MLKGKYDCTGCSLCEVVCPKNAIRMEQNEEGFLFPCIDVSKCVDCKICEKFCNKTSMLLEGKKINVLQSTEKEILRTSTSGGAVSVLANIVLDKGGVIFGAAYNPQNGARWERVENKNDLRKIRGSKYFQIPLVKDIYYQIFEEIKNGRNVLFIGTPCQVDSLNKYIPDHCKASLFTIDLICGGVVSPYIEEKYINYHVQKHGCDVEEHIFRSKENRWTKKYSAVLTYADGKCDSFMGGEDYFTRAYTSNRLMRESCYRCVYTQEKRAGDISVGDCWGIETVNNRISDVRDGVSLVLVNSLKGERLLNEAVDVYREEFVEDDILRYNRPLHSSGKRWLLRNIAYQLYARLPFSLATNLVGYRYIIKRIIRRT